MYDGSKWSEAYQMENSLHTYHLCNWSENIIADDRKKMVYEITVWETTNLSELHSHWKWWYKRCKS